MDTLEGIEGLLVPVSEAELPMVLESLQARLCAVLSASASLLYVADALDPTLYRFEVGASLARKPIPEYFRSGEGFLGQVVKEKSPFVERFPTSLFGELASSALVEVSEITIVAIPLLYQDQVEGLWCIAAPELVIDTFKHPHWQDVLYKWAAYLQSIRSRRSIQTLLEQSQVQNQELITREEELRQNLEELAVTQEEMRRAQQLLARQSERQNFIIDLFTLMAAANPANLRSLSRIFLAQLLQYFRAKVAAVLLREENRWKALFTWTTKDVGFAFPSAGWEISPSLMAALEAARQPTSSSTAELGLLPDQSYYWLILPYYTVQGLQGLIVLAFSEPYPLMEEGGRGGKDLLHIPIAYFSAYERVREGSTTTQAALELIAQVSGAQSAVESIETPLEELSWLNDIPLVQREAYISALKEAIHRQVSLWTPPTQIASRELVVIGDKYLYRLRWP
ncbi:MAG: hypothetical protein NZ611_05375 [Bacteroidia bacterium]|nr:hypothetical protein [Bacteroidia bacterium]